MKNGEITSVRFDSRDIATIATKMFITSNVQSVDPEAFALLERLRTRPRPEKPGCRK
jgi:hypothetical protein